MFGSRYGHRKTQQVFFRAHHERTQLVERLDYFQSRILQARLTRGDRESRRAISVERRGREFIFYEIAANVVRSISDELRELLNLEIGHGAQEEMEFSMGEISVILFDWLTFQRQYAEV